MMARILKGPEIPLPIITKGMGEIFFDTAAKYGDEVFQIDAYTEETETWNQVKQRSVRLAIYLKSIGITAKDVVMMVFPNNTEIIVPLLAAILLGAYPSCLDLSHGVSEIKYAMSYLQPKVIIVGKEAIDKLERSLNDADADVKNNPTIIVAGYKNTLNYVSMDMICETVSTMESEEDFKPHPCNVNDTAIIQFSSGTTNVPKGICLSHKCLLRAGYRYPTAKTTTLTHNSFYWIASGLFLGIMLVNGCRKVVAPNIPAEKLLQIIEKYKIPVLVCSSMLACDFIEIGEKKVSQYNTSNLRMLSLTGSAFSPTQIRTMVKLFPHTSVCISYGGSESGSGGAFHRILSNLSDEKIKSAGKVTPNTQIKIVDTETRELLPPNQEGEILIKDPYIMNGYYKLDNIDPFDSDGFLKTGDLGYYDSDEFLYVTDRLNSTFKYQNYRISPIIIETILKEHPDVQEALVFGIPDERDQYHPAACVVLKIDHNVSCQELTELVDSQVPDHFKLRGGLKIVPELPFTVTGKIQRKNIMELFLKS